MNERVDPRIEIGVAFLLIVIAAVAIYETRDIPPGTFEPLGSAPVPQAVAGLIILLCLGLIVRALLCDRPAIASEPDARFGDAAVVVVLTLVYAAAMHFRIATFAIITLVYLTLTIGWLTRFQRRLLPYVIIVALVTGFGCQYIFTRVFVVDLPGL